MIGIGSPRASIESNFALRELVGAENFYTGIAKAEQERLQMMLTVLRDGGIHTRRCATLNPTMRFWYSGKILPRPAPALPWPCARR